MRNNPTSRNRSAQPRTNTSDDQFVDRAYGAGIVRCRVLNFNGISQNPRLRPALNRPLTRPAGSLRTCTGSRRLRMRETTQCLEVLLQQQISRSGHPESRGISFPPRTAICCFPRAAGSRAFPRCQASLRQGGWSCHSMALRSAFLCKSYCWD